MFGDIVTFMNLDATGFSDGGGLSMGVSPVADCLPKYLRTVGGVEVCADGNAADNWDTPPAGGWGFHDNGFGDPVECKKNADNGTDVFCGRDGNFKSVGTSSLAFSG
mmetsp:Transcript_5723/g.8489  ORF Transcript_5723/g.8489 Transcript_5723/m.8489 type:complete len:107 (-) Transcript_5723:30-350(-)|eukprot:CAMPEP_0179433776 /NCGR_PEP_ID=MMETSP0799-20121207/18121_1 /TAXON_ID=46947 /ORGANISM="Geminigera cryophila, Strain CCMP2564" /LENGTH=106 /DNA_ID=CAMNT_0021211955 /DNA_START=13 /DNA_END=333 /DNA_ORIENTATION=+